MGATPLSGAVCGMLQVSVAGIPPAAAALLGVSGLQVYPTLWILSSHQRPPCDLVAGVRAAGSAASPCSGWRGSPALQWPLQGNACTTALQFVPDHVAQAEV